MKATKVLCMILPHGVVWVGVVGRGMILPHGVKLLTKVSLAMNLPLFLASVKQYSKVWSWLPSIPDN